MALGQASARGAQFEAQPQAAGGESSFAISAPSLTLPKGGGAIRGIGEKFAANPVTGTGSMSVPIATSPGRSGFGPQLSLSYDSGAGNGPFGFGWSMSLPSITRKTDKGLPQYLDDVESDVFILSGAEDLVPVLQADGTRFHDDTTAPGFIIHRYRPRAEGLFARIERWTKIGSPGEVHWRSISKDNIVTLYGRDENSRIADPLADPLKVNRVFSWLICESCDDKGNGIRYRYKSEDGVYQPRQGQADPFIAAHQTNRGNNDDVRRTAQRYLHRVLYGNLKPLLDGTGRRPRDLSDLPEPPTDADWLFEVRFDYGELDDEHPMDGPEHSWFYRPDAFSSYRSGFEVRTCRRCERVLMLHHILEQPASASRAAQSGYQGVVRSNEFTYDDEIDPGLATRPVYSFLKQVVQTGWKRERDSTTRRSLPPVEFEYTRPVVQGVVENVDPASLDNLPVGLDGGAYRWTDLHGEGIPGILTEQTGSWFYKQNLSPLGEGAAFAPLETVALKPNVALGAGAEFMDLAGDGQPDVVVMEGPTPGLYEHDEARGWQPFHPFASRLNRDLRDPNLKFVDLDGDGRMDALISEDDAFVWHASLVEEGFGPARRVTKALDEERGPRIVFADGAQSIYLADLSGDGLTDIVRVRNGDVCYWPNLGYGRFGAKVTMDNSPWFDHADQFDQRRIRLADIDGSGTTDIIYLHRDGVRLYFNQSGNSWSQPETLAVFPRIDDLVSIVPVDLLGNGTACLVWSSPLPGDTRRQMRYVNLMGGSKPHLLIKTTNNLGAETRIDYASSTKFYLSDKRDGKPWLTRLPFPVHVVESVQTYDYLSRNRFATRYAYHHGYFDGEEREFRGFGMVEQWDTEQLAALADGQLPNDQPPADNIAGDSHVPPVHIKTWFHTGSYVGRERVSRQFEDEYFREPGLTPETARPLLLEDTIIPPDLTVHEEREACRALKGSMLRREVYADDADGPDATPAQIERARIPYTVAEQNFTIRALQPRSVNRHAVLFAHPRESLTYHYERNATDPRIQHTLTLEVDDFGNVLKQAAVGYGRRASPLVEKWDQEQQTTPLLTYTENSVTNGVDLADTQRNPLPCETLTYELTGYTTTGPAGRYQASDFVGPLAGAADGRLRHRFTDEVAYEADPTNNACRRPIEHLRTLFRPDDCGVAKNNPLVLLKLCELQALALPGENYKLAFTPGLLDQLYVRPLSTPPAEDLLPQAARGTVLGGQSGDQAGYVDLDGNGHWWIPSGRSFYITEPASDAAAELAHAQSHFFLPRRYSDPFGHNAFVDFDPNDLLMAETRDALGNRVTVEFNDYRVLQPRLVSDPNRNQTEVAFDALGMVVGTAVMGKPLPATVEGDSLNGFVTDPTQVELDELFAASDPRPTAAALLKDASTRIVYDLDRFWRTKRFFPRAPEWWQPACAATIARETHVSDLNDDASSRLQLSFSYSDGFGREIQKKIQAEPGVASVDRSTPAQYLIDDFSSGPFHADYVTRGTDDSDLVTDTQTQVGTMAGGERQWRLRLRGESGKEAAVDVQSDADRFEFRSEIGVYHGFDWSYGATYVRYVPMSLDLRGYSALRFHFLTLPRGLSFNVLLYFRGQIDNYAQLGVNLPPRSGPFDLDFNFDSFRTAITDPARPADFSQLSGIYLVINSGGWVGDGGESFSIGAISAVSLPRWVASGWTVFNNKGKPVRQYEPFFTDGHQFDFGVRNGVSPVVFYDPAERVVATLHPNHTYEKVVFDPWQQTTYDVNDTCAPRNLQTGDPRTDPEIRGYVAEYFRTQPGWKTWMQQRIADPRNPPNDTRGKEPEQDAAVRALAHADTPVATHFDVLGRTFLTVARNRVQCQDHPLNNRQDDEFRTRVELDVEGNQRSVLDERRLPDADNLPLGGLQQRVVMQYGYDMLGNRIHQFSMEAGARWMLKDVIGKPIRAWDSRGHDFATAYDALRRPIAQTVRGTTTDSDPRTLNRDILVDKIEYGETLANAEALNLHTRIYRHFDSAGVATNAQLDAATGIPTEAYDFKGNPLHSTRQLVSDYTGIPDWLSAPALDTELFEGSTRYDALNRPIQSIAPHSSLTRAEHPNKFNIIQPVFNGANLLERVDVWLERAAEPPALLDPATDATSRVGVASIDYDAKGRRTLIDYKTRDATVIRTAYAYDPETFRPKHLYTRRGVNPKTAEGVAFSDDCDNLNPPPDTIAAPKVPPAVTGCGLQNLHYTYDPAGNITHIRDDAQQTLYFRNRRVEPSNDYVYDALYRLIQADGREHLGQLGNGQRLPPTSPDAFNTFHTRLDHPGNGDAMGTYTERYVYDAVGNFLLMQHRGSDPAHAGWTRAYSYAEDSLTEPGKAQSNRLTSTALIPAGSTPQPEKYLHDAHGNMRMPHLTRMDWDYRDRLLATSRQVVNEEPPPDKLQQTTYYVYDAGGQRVRKVSVKSESLVEERIYLGGFEIFRKHEGRFATSISAENASLERETLHVVDDRQRFALVETRAFPRTPDSNNPLQLIRYQFGIHPRSSSLELDEQARIISYEEYAPYGSSTYQAARSRTETAKRYRYTGIERDEESGLAYHAARYCSAWLGRWVSCDPSGISGGIDLYAYSANNPIALLDVSGLAPNTKEPMGTRKTYEDFGIAHRDAHGKRISEDEHLHERVLQEKTMKPQGDPKKQLVSRKDYEGQSATRWDRDAAIIKTKNAMKLRDKLASSDPTKPTSDDLADQVRPENAAKRSIDARDKAIEARKLEGKSTTSLEKITDEILYEGTHDQLGDIHHQRRTDPAPPAIEQSTEADIIKAVSVVDEGAASSGPLIEGGPSTGAATTAGKSIKGGVKAIAPIVLTYVWDKAREENAQSVKYILSKSNPTPEELKFARGEGFELIDGKWFWSPSLGRRITEIFHYFLTFEHPFQRFLTPPDPNANPIT